MVQFENMPEGVGLISARDSSAMQRFKFMLGNKPRVVASATTGAEF
jgi:hypothetical protein